MAEERENLFIIQGGLANKIEAEQLAEEALQAKMDGDEAGSEGLYRRALSLDPNNVRAIVNLAIYHQGRKDLREAIRLTRRAVDLSPKLDSAHSLLCDLLEQAGELNEAIIHAEIAYALAPEQDYRRKVIEIRMERSSAYDRQRAQELKEVYEQIENQPEQVTREEILKRLEDFTRR